MTQFLFDMIQDDVDLYNFLRKSAKLNIILVMIATVPFGDILGTDLDERII